MPAVVVCGSRRRRGGLAPHIDELARDVVALVYAGALQVAKAEAAL